MDTLAAGFAIALLVSMPPGANTALCVTSARDGARRAAPIILSAALTDVTYALLAAAGVIAINSANATATHWLAAGFSIVAAGLLWKHGTRSISSRAAAGFALFNPATAVLWLGLSAMTATHPHGVSATVLWATGVAAGTTTWFSGLAILSSRMHRTLTLRQRLAVQRGFSVLLAAAAVLLIA
jgi:threonine/homoserine/homoserine lactone efflux protein